MMEGGKAADRIHAGRLKRQGYHAGHHRVQMTWVVSVDRLREWHERLVTDIKRICGKGMLHKMATVPSCSAADIQDGEGPLVF